LAAAIELPERRRVALFISNKLSTIWRCDIPISN
jgi:hypothetical protein